MPPNNGTPESNGSPKPQGISAPSVVIPKEPTPQMVKQEIIKQKYPAIPHVDTFAGKYNIVNMQYNIYFDEALRNSQTNTLVMRRDAYINELIRHRQQPVLSIPWHLETDDPEHPDQIGISQTLTKVIKNIPYLSYMLMNLLEAIFYGKFASQIVIGPRKVAGNQWNSVTSHLPINGDKLRYHWDGTPGIAIYSGSNSQQVDRANKILSQYGDYIEPTMLGKALFLRDEFLRERFIIHKFEPSDTDYLFEVDESQSVFGLGLRSRLYWIWNLRTEVLGWLITALERVGANGMLFGFFDDGNPASALAVINSLKLLAKDNIAAFPRKPADNVKDMIQQIQPSAVGYDVMFQLIQWAEGIMRRCALGQDLSSESKPLGMGSGAANLHADVRLDYMEYDAGALAETLTSQLVYTLQKINKWKYEGKVIRGDDLPFGMKWTYTIDRQNMGERLEAAEKCYNMGVPLDTEEVRKSAGFGPPKKKTSVLMNPQLQQMEQENAAGTPATNHLHDSLKGILGKAKEAEGAGMLGGRQNGSSRFGKKPESVACLGGRLYVSKSGWGLLSVPNDLVYGIYDAIAEQGVELPPNSDHGKQKLNAHISVFNKDEITGIVEHRYGGLVERGHQFHYNLGPIKTVKPRGWSEMSHVWFVEVESQELENLRASYGLSRLPNKGKHKFHISIGIRKSGSEVKSKFSRAGDCGHNPDGSFSSGNTCALIHRSARRAKTYSGKITERYWNSLPPKIRKPLRKFAGVYGSTFKVANRTAIILARKHGYSKNQAQILSRILSVGDMAGMSVTSTIADTVGLGWMERTAGGFLPLASSAYLLNSLSKNPMETLTAAKIAVKKVMRDISKFQLQKMLP